MKVIIIIIAYLVVMNIAGFASMGIDKWKAKRHEYRISEPALFLFAIFGGSIGSIIGMYKFRHKTRHWYFVYGLPAIMAIQIIIAAWLIGSPMIEIMK
ncbi:Uncharacterized membrane protein YsdA, DUF1294 family [Lachnospiraceae bacterium XPB1003]|nr:Uncharacterized membrane protein YsdA, DUF1294 family [Lachnospiraceae bacterium XPB1003]